MAWCSMACSFKLHLAGHLRHLYLARAMQRPVGKRRRRLHNASARPPQQASGNVQRPLNLWEALATGAAAAAAAGVGAQHTAACANLTIHRGFSYCLSLRKSTRGPSHVLHCDVLLRLSMWILKKLPGHSAHHQKVSHIAKRIYTGQKSFDKQTTLYLT